MVSSSWPQSHSTSSFSIHFFMLIAVLAVLVRSLFSFFHVDHGRLLQGGKLSFGYFHRCELYPFISFFHRSILIVSGVCVKLIVVFRKYFLDLIRLLVQLFPRKGCLMSDSWFVFSTFAATFRLCLEVLFYIIPVLFELGLVSSIHNYSIFYNIGDIYFLSVCRVFSRNTCIFTCWIA